MWRGFDLQLERVVAIKLPKVSAITGREAFLAEARRVAALQHPHIVTVHDIGQDGDRWFIVSEFVPGGSLAASLALGPIPRGDTVRWVCQVADALDAAHRAGLVHRDVKAENILIDSAGQARLTDFGIARPQGKPEPAANGIGTLRAMAPEQLAGGYLTPATDVYALGLVLHEALAGTLPFRSISPAGIRGGVARGIADRVACSLPLRLAAVCRRALALDPCHRYQTARGFAQAVRWASHPVRPWLLAAPILLAGFFTLAVLATWPSPHSPGTLKDGTLAVIIPE
ncbi:MAG: serine/threonine-protein kinase [Planctomycetota bacterium]